MGECCAGANGYEANSYRLLIILVYERAMPDRNEAASMTSRRIALYAKNTCEDVQPTGLEQVKLLALIGVGAGVAWMVAG